jgi:hypothetical protein
MGVNGEQLMRGEGRVQRGGKMKTQTKNEKRKTKNEK